MATYSRLSASGAVGVVNNGQQESIIKWARDRDTLSRERKLWESQACADLERVLEAWAVLLMKSEVEDKDVRISWRFTALRKQGRRMPTYTVLRWR
jgi:hypothetical protein